MLPRRQYPVHRRIESLVLFNDNKEMNGNDILFDGICIDNGAQRSVAGIVETHAYLKSTSQQWIPTKTRNLFRFGE